MTKVVSSESGEKYAQIKHCLQVKSKLSKKTNSLVDFGERTTGIDLFSGGIVIMDYGLVFWPGVTSKMKLKCFNDGFIYKHAVWLHTMLIGGLDGCGLLVDCCGVFIICLDSHSDGTHSLQRIHWWTSDAKYLFWWRNKLIYILEGWVSTYYANVHFVWTIPLNTQSH